MNSLLKVVLLVFHTFDYTHCRSCLQKFPLLQIWPLLHNSLIRDVEKKAASCATFAQLRQNKPLARRLVGAVT